MNIEITVATAFEVGECLTERQVPASIAIMRYAVEEDRRHKKGVLSLPEEGQVFHVSIQIRDQYGVAFTDSRYKPCASNIHIA
jgi:hypothetical protein